MTPGEAVVTVLVIALSAAVIALVCRIDDASRVPCPACRGVGCTACKYRGWMSA